MSSATNDTDVVKFLLVDDLHDNLVALQGLLAAPGLELLLAHSGREALEVLLLHDVALALIDVHMPDIDGFELAELMRGRERTRHVPIIFVTASDHEAHREFNGYEAGAVDFLFKPIDARVLRSKVSVFVQLHRQRLQLERQVAELTRVREELQSTLRLNELFVAAVGHDLRSPLQAILGAADVLTTLGSDGLLKRAADAVRNSGKSMERLIADLFDLSRARLGGGIPVERGEVIDLWPIATDVIGEAKLSSEFHNFELERRGNLCGDWDAVRLQQVLTNLIGNAVRHGTADAPIRIVLDGDRDSEVVVEVSNAGAIPSDVLPHIFDPFRSFATPRRGKGLGLGLYIVQQIVRAHGGDVQATTSSSTTTVQVRLPRSRESMALAS